MAGRGGGVDPDRPTIAAPAKPDGGGGVRGHSSASGQLDQWSLNCITWSMD